MKTMTPRHMCFFSPFIYAAGDVDGTVGTGDVNVVDDDDNNDDNIDGVIVVVSWPKLLIRYAYAFIDCILQSAYEYVQQ